MNLLQSTTTMRYWIMKSEPEELGIDDLMRLGQARWDGIRNYQARNFIRDMLPGERCFFYHSSCEVPGIYGTMRTTGEPYPDPLAFDPASLYYDAKHASKSIPWLSIDMIFEEKFMLPLTLTRIRALPLGPCPLTARGNRLSIIPLTRDQFDLLYSYATKVLSL